jgi:hypothetical protein
MKAKPLSSLALAALGALTLALAGCSTSPEPKTATARVAFATEITPESFAPIAACHGLDANETRGGFFRDDRRPIGAENIYGEQRIGARNVISKPTGARVIIAATPSMNAPWLERVAHCHAEMYRATGQTAADEPLSVPGAVVKVRPVHAGYAIEITAPERADAREIQARAASITASR